MADARRCVRVSQTGSAVRTMMSKPGRVGKRSALHFVLLFGAVNLSM
jgi:hypothetical protein